MTGGNTRARTTWVVAAAVLLLVLAGAAWWMWRPWASEAELATLKQLRDKLTASYEANPPIANWHITSIYVASPGLVVTLEMPADRVAITGLRPVMDRLETAGAICPDSTDPIYNDLGRFSIEIHPTVHGRPVLINADCRNVRGVKARG